MLLSLLYCEVEDEQLLLKVLQRCNIFLSAQQSRTHAKESLLALKQCGLFY